MAVTATHLTTAVSDTDATSYTTASISPAANNLVLVAVYSHDASAPTATPTLTGAGLTWVQVGTLTTTGDSQARLTLFRTLSASPGSGALTIDFGGETQNRCMWSISSFGNVDTSGANGAGAVVQSATNTASSVTTLTVTLSAFGNTNNATYGCLGQNAGTQAITAGTGFTELGEANSGEFEAIETEWRVDNDTSVNWTTSENNLAGIAVEIRE